MGDSMEEMLAEKSNFNAIAASPGNGCQVRVIVSVSEHSKILKPITVTTKFQPAET